MDHKHRDCTTCTSRLDSVFCGLDHPDLESLSQAKTTNFYHRGQILFYEGNQPTGLFCIATGKIKLYKNGDDGNEMLLRIAHAGDILGYRSLLTEENYAATAQVLEDANVCFIDKSFLTKLIQKNSSLAFQILRRLAFELGAQEARLSDMVNKTVRQRLCHLLLAMAKTYGLKDAEGTLLDVRLTRAEIASMVGATPETVIRLLSDFKDSELVAFRDKRIVIMDSQALLREAEVEF